MGPTWVLSAPDGPHVGPMNLDIRGVSTQDKMFDANAMYQEVYIRNSQNLTKQTSVCIQQHFIKMIGGSVDFVGISKCRRNTLFDFKTKSSTLQLKE